MHDCFISYGSADGEFAAWVANELRAHAVSFFLAADSLRPGVEWSSETRQALMGSNWVVFLISQASAASPYVMQEAGMALADASKRVVPVVWDMDPSRLPGWLNERQAIDLRSADAYTVRHRVAELATKVQANKRKGLWIGAALLAALVVFGGE